MASTLERRIVRLEEIVDRQLQPEHLTAREPFDHEGYRAICDELSRRDRDWGSADWSLKALKESLDEQAKISIGRLQ